MFEAIDVHSHFNHGSNYDTQTSEIYLADLENILKKDKEAGIEKIFSSTFSSVLNTAEIVEENDYLYFLAQKNNWLYQWVVIDPRNKKTFIQAEDMLKSEKCIGIKIHPVYHRYSLENYGDKIFSFASEYETVVLIHPEKNADYILPFADKFSKVKFIIAHLGSFDGTKYAEAIKYAKHSNIYTDTSGIASSNNNIIEYTVNKVGSERILFGTDTYSAAFQRGRIQFASISEEDKKNILRYNAENLFKITK